MVVFTSLQPKGKDQQGGYQTCHDLSPVPAKHQPRCHTRLSQEGSRHTQKRQIPLFSGLHQSPHAASQPMTQLPFPPGTALFTWVTQDIPEASLAALCQTLAASHTPLLPWLRPTSPTDGYSCTHRSLPLPPVPGTLSAATL